VKAKARIAALFNRSGAGRDAERVACASRVCVDVNGSGAPAAGRGRLAFAGAILASLIAILAIVLTSVAPATASEGCPNEARREEQGAAGRALPDCRAYELVSPSYMPSPDYRHYFEGVAPTETTSLYPRQPANLPPVETGVSAARNGNAMLFSSREPNSWELDDYTNLSRRGPNGWTGENIAPPQSRVGFLCLASGYVGHSANLDQVAFVDGWRENSAGSANAPEICGHDEPRLVPGEPEDSANLFLRDTASGSFQLVNLTPPGVESYDPFLDAMSPDGSHLVFQSKAQLTPDAPSTTAECEYGDVYVWSASTVHLLTVLPGGARAHGTLTSAVPMGGCGSVPLFSADTTNAISANGERILFYAGGEFTAFSEQLENRAFPPIYLGGGLYMREHPGAEQSALNGASECTEPAKACTIQIDVHDGGSGSSGNGQFQWASADTSKIFFTDEEKLTSDSTAQAGKPDLYEYDLEKPAAQRLTDLTANVSEPADVLGVSGASEDGSYVYFVAQGVLTGSQENSHHAKAEAGKPNLYLRHTGTTTFIATLSAEGGNRCDWAQYCLSARVSSNGAFIAFDSMDSLTGYDNHPVHPEACRPLTLVSESPCMEIFRYAAASGANGELTCASCNPTGAPPASEFAWSGIGMPQEAGSGEHSRIVQPSHNVSDTGEVFFDTMEKLVPTDENETWDVYQYDGGEGPSAHLHLISSGKSEVPSYFADATPNASDVFFFTAQPLLRSDTRSDYDVYDARVGGGFAEPLIPQCEAEGCRPAYPGAPGSSSPASAFFEGKGNVHPPAGKGSPPPAKCKKGLIRSRGKCVKQRKKQKKHHRRSARRNRRAGK